MYMVRTELFSRIVDGPGSTKQSLVRGSVEVVFVSFRSSGRPATESGSGVARVQFRGIVDQRAQRAEPGFVASPARDGGAIDRLPGLPLARGLHRARIRFGAQAGVVPRETAGREDPPDHRF